MILLAVASVSVALSITFGAEVVAALGLMLAQVKILWAKLLGLSTKTLLVWLKAQGINFARVEIVKRWFLKSLLPLLIGAATQRRIADFARAYVRAVRVRVRLMLRWYRRLPPLGKLVLILIAMFATLAIAVTTMSLWLFLFSIQLPLWIIAGITAFWNLAWSTLQKLAFRTLAFMQIYRAWGFLRRRMPPAYLQRLRRFNFRVARVVVRRRRMTLAQLHAQKNSLAMRWELFREYFRHRRPEQPTEEEFQMLRRAREGRDG